MGFYPTPLEKVRPGAMALDPDDPDPESSSLAA